MTDKNYISNIANVYCSEYTEVPKDGDVSRASKEWEVSKVVTKIVQSEVIFWEVWAKNYPDLHCCTSVYQQRLRVMGVV
jgi:hypothetical protein